MLLKKYHRLLETVFFQNRPVSNMLEEKQTERADKIQQKREKKKKEKKNNGFSMFSLLSIRDGTGKISGR